MRGPDLPAEEFCPARSCVQAGSHQAIPCDKRIFYRGLGGDGKESGGIPFPDYVPDGFGTKDEIGLGESEEQAERLRAGGYAQHAQFEQSANLMHEENTALQKQAERVGMALASECVHA